MRLWILDVGLVVAYEADGSCLRRGFDRALGWLLVAGMRRG